MAIIRGTNKNDIIYGTAGGDLADRDLNAAQNILRLGSSLQDRTCAFSAERVLRSCLL